MYIILRENVRILYLKTNIEMLIGYQYEYVIVVRLLTVDLIIYEIKAKVKVHTVQMKH